MKLLSVVAAAEVLDVSRQTVTRMIADGQLPAVCLRSGRRKKVWRICEEVLQKWIETREAETKKMIQRNRPASLAVVNGDRSDHG